MTVKYKWKHAIELEVGDRCQGVSIFVTDECVVNKVIAGHDGLTVIWTNGILSAFREDHMIQVRVSDK